MVKFGCYNGELDTTNYSAPMPAIGVYIALSCLVCFFSILFDFYYSIRRRKLCWPSKLFTPNSFTLTVISVAIKLPVDLNTAMPRAIDQLSKLTSTCFLFVSLGLFMSSLGTTKMSECIANMVTLTVLVVTIVVNMCIQMFTGVIFAFTIEHLVVLSCTLILLALLWSSASSIDSLKDAWGVFSNDISPSEWTVQGMGKQIKNLYADSYSMNPQLFMCGTPICSSICVLCAIVSLVLLEAIFSFIFLEVGIGPSTIKDRRFCERESDYKWSIWCVVVTQTITIMVGSFTLMVRWLLPLAHMSLPTSLSKTLEELETIRKFIWAFGLQKQMSLRTSILGVIKNGIIALLIGVQDSLVLASELVLFSCLILINTYKRVVSLCCKDGGPKESKSNLDEDRDHYVVFSYRLNDDEFNEWLKKGILNNMEGWVRESKNEDLTHLIKHLSNFSPPQSAHSLLHHIFNNKTIDYNVSCLSILVLAKYATILGPSPLSDSLIERSVKEAFELIYFIDQKMNTRSRENKLRWILAKGMWLNMVDNYFNKKFIAPIFKEGSQKMQGIDRFWLIVDAFTKFRRDLEEEEEVKGKLLIPVLSSEFKVIGECFMDKRNASVVELQECIETTIAELLHLFLKHLPIALHKEYSEISHEDSEERMRRALKYFCKLEILDEKLKDNKVPWEWKWPNETLLKKEKKKKNYLYPEETTVSDDIEGRVVSGSEHVAIDPVGEIIEVREGG